MSDSRRIVVTLEAHHLAALMAATLDVSAKRLVSELIEARADEVLPARRKPHRRKSK